MNVTCGKWSRLFVSSIDVVAVVVAEHAVDDLAGGCGRPIVPTIELRPIPFALTLR